MTRLHPVFLDLEGRQCIVVGGGAVALAKLQGLLTAGADVTVIAPTALEEVRALAAERQIDLKLRPYARGDLSGALLVIAATDSVEVNREVRAEAQSLDCLVSVVDTPPLCDFTTPSTIRRGDLTVALSTAGRAPALAAKLRRQLESQLDDGTSELLDEARFWRRRIVRSAASREQRREDWRALARDGSWPGSLGIKSGQVLPDHLEFPVTPPGAAPPSWERIGVLGTDLLHGSVADLARIASALDAPELRERVLSLKDAVGEPLLQAFAVLRSRQRAELVFESYSPDAATVAVAAALADSLGAGVESPAPSRLSLTGAAAVTHVACLASGLRSIVAFDADDASVVAEADTQGDGDGLREVLRSCGRLGSDVLEATGLADRQDALLQHGLGFLRDRLRDFDEHDIATGNAGENSESFDATGRPMLLVLDRDSPPLDQESALSILDRGRRKLCVLDLAAPAASEEGLARLNRVSRWDLDTLADLPAVPDVSTDVDERARSILTDGLRKIAQ